MAIRRHNYILYATVVTVLVYGAYYWPGFCSCHSERDIIHALADKITSISVSPIGERTIYYNASIRGKLLESILTGMRIVERENTQPIKLGEIYPDDQILLYSNSKVIAMLTTYQLGRPQTIAVISKVPRVLIDRELLFVPRARYWFDRRRAWIMS